MGKIAFFHIPAHGHANPTFEVMHALTQRGHEVRCYSFDLFRTRVKQAGASLFSCDEFIPVPPQDLHRRMGHDAACLIAMLVDTALRMEDAVLTDLQLFAPDCAVVDSLCIWGRLFAQRLGLPVAVSTTTFAFNRATSRLMKRDLKEILYAVRGLPQILSRLRALKRRGYDASVLGQLAANDPRTPTIVYTSRAFQPDGESFGENYAFVGPSLPALPKAASSFGKPLLYVSLGTAVYNPAFFQNCIEALRDFHGHVLLSAGSEACIACLRDIPPHITVYPSVPQLAVLQEADGFITHCGMNSVSESLSLGVPMVLCPQQSEQRAVARRIQALGAGLFPPSRTPAGIRRAVDVLLRDRARFQAAIAPICESFRQSGGASRAADFIERIARSKI